MMRVSEAAWLLVLAGTALASQERCPSGCVCKLQVVYSSQQPQQEYQVICSLAGQQELTLDGDLFPAQRRTDVHRVKVKVEGAAAVTLTQDFVRRWLRYHSSALDVWHCSRLLLPQHIQAPPSSLSTTSTFAGIGIVNATVNFLPAGLFGQKVQVGLKLASSKVGRIAPELLRGNGLLRYLQIWKSVVGSLEGPLGHNDLETGEDEASVFIQYSTIGELTRGALRLHTKTGKNVILHDVTLGKVHEGALNITGSGSLLMDTCRIADMETNAVIASESLSYAIKNSWLSLRPGALANLSCNGRSHRIHTNHISVLSSPGNDDADNSTTLNIREDISEQLETVLHPTCIVENLPSWVNHLSENVKYNSSSPNVPKIHLGIGLYVLGFVALVLVVLILSLVYLVSRKHRRPRHHRPSTTVIMSQLQQEEPIYEEPSVFAPVPPQVPPPLTCSSRSFPVNNGGCGLGSMDAKEDQFFGGRPERGKPTENDYLNMSKS